MAQTKVVIVYSPNLNRRRTVIIPDDDSQIAIHQQNIVAGEAVYIGLLSDYHTIGPDAMLAQYLGVVASSDRCVIVSANTVICGCNADPAIDTHPGGTLMLHPTAMVGWTLVKGMLTAPASTL